MSLLSSSKTPFATLKIDLKHCEKQLVATILQRWEGRDKREGYNVQGCQWLFETVCQNNGLVIFWPFLNVD